MGLKKTKAELRELKEKAELKELKALAKLNGLVPPDLAPDLTARFLDGLQSEQKEYARAVENVWGINDEGVDSQIEALYEISGYAAAKELIEKKGNLLKGLAKAFDDAMKEGSCDSQQ